MKKVIAAFFCSAWLMLGGATGESGQAQAQEKKLTDITFSLDFITLAGTHRSTLQSTRATTRKKGWT